MRTLFIHQPIFRLLSPLFSGSLIYLLILLIRNDVGQLDELFLGEELYVCVGLSYLIQEFSRLLLKLFKRVQKPSNFLLRMGLQTIVIISISLLIVSIALYYYFDIFVGYPPTRAELLTFNIIFAVITVIYVTLSLSHQLLSLINTQKVSAEMEKKQAIAADYLQFVEGINPDLLFEGLEALLVEIKLSRQEQDKAEENADEIVDNLATVYRYLLGTRSQELVKISEELEALKSLIDLYAHLPYRKVKVLDHTDGALMVIPGSLFQIIQVIIKASIPSHKLTMQVDLSVANEFLSISTEKNDRIDYQFPVNFTEKLRKKYHLYSKFEVKIEEKSTIRTLYLPIIPLPKEAL